MRKNQSEQEDKKIDGQRRGEKNKRTKERELQIERCNVSILEKEELCVSYNYHICPFTLSLMFNRILDEIV